MCRPPIAEALSECQVHGMRSWRLLIAVMAANVASGAHAQSTPPPPGIPFPPPPPPAAETQAIREAITRADRCFSDHSPGALAKQATRQLSARPGSKKWNKAREVVLAYVQRRQEQRRCLLELETLRTEVRMTRQDRTALTFFQRALAASWLVEGVHEVAILRRLLGIPSPEQDDYLPAHLHP